MPLHAKKHEPVTKRLKLFLYGDPGAGKTTAAIQFPYSYVIDCERGADHYSKQLAASKSVLLQTVDADEVIQEVRALGTEKHDYRTLIIDPITTMEADLVQKAEKEFGAGDMRIWGKRDKIMRRLMNLLTSLDMNVIITAHGKVDYGPNMTRLGKTFDGWKRLPYVFDLAIELEKRAGKRVGIVRKTRLEGFPDGVEFEFSYTEILQRYGEELIERPTVPVAIASAEKVARLNELIKTLNVDEATVDGWLRKAGVDTLDDMPETYADKAIEAMVKKIDKLKGKETA